VGETPTLVNSQMQVPNPPASSDVLNTQKGWSQVKSYPVVPGAGLF